MNFYTYIYFDPRTNEAIYVGKGHDNRAWHHVKADTLFGRTYRKRIREGYSLEPIIYHLPNEAEAFQLEVFWIMFYGRRDLGLGTLLNQTNGGEGCSGLIHTEEAKAKIRAFQKGKPKSKEHAAKVGAGNKGKVISQQQRDRQRIFATGRTHTEETKALLRSQQKGRPKSPEHVAKVAAAVRAACARRKAEALEASNFHQSCTTPWN